MTALEPATAPTLYFFGVTTAKSSIMKVFPAWAKHLGLGDAVIKGVDFPLHAPSRRVSGGGQFPQDRPAVARRLGDDAQDRPLRRLPRSVRRDRPSCALHGRDELPVQAWRPPRLPRQGPDFVRSRARRFSARAPFRTDGRGGLLHGGGRIDDRAHLAPHAAEPRRRPTFADYRFEPQRRAPRGDPAYPLRPGLGGSDRVRARAAAVRQRRGAREPQARIARHQRDRARKGRAGLAAH